jgi:glycosyltransferase involved in cell wall biosynthesis
MTRPETVAEPARLAPGGITACVASIPTRWGTDIPVTGIGCGGRGALQRTLMSVLDQTLQPAAISVQVDTAREGAWVVRNRLVDSVLTPWMAFCDDDDWWYREHLALLAACAAEHDADYVFSYFDTNMHDPLGLFGKPFDPAAPHHTTMNILVRTDLARVVGFTPPHPKDTVSGEDWRFTLGCVTLGAKIVHLPQRTWYFNYHGTPAMRGPNPNTSGQPHNW